MKFHRNILREILLLIAASILLGLGYTFITKQGIFSAKDTSAGTLNTNLEMIPLPRAKELYESGQALFIDSRHEFEYKSGHIKNAVNVPLNEFNAHAARLNGISKDKILVVYCDGQDCNASIELAIKLQESGFTNVKIYFGGWSEWKDNNLPVAKLINGKNN